MGLSVSLFGRAGIGEGEYADIRTEHTRTTELLWRAGKLVSASVAAEAGSCARVVTGRGSSFVSFTDAGYASALREAQAQVALLDPDPADPGGLAAADSAQGQVGPVAPAEAALSDKMPMLAQYAAGISGAHRMISGSLLHFRESRRRVHLVTAQGTDVGYEYADLTLQLTVYASSGRDRGVGSVSLGSAGDFTAAVGIEPLIEAACATAVDSATAPYCEAGRYDVVCDPSLAGIWAHETVGHLSEADHQQPGARPALAGPEFLTIIDAGARPGARGSVTVDEEGVTSTAVDLVRAGKPGGLLHSRTTARRFGEKPTGSARAISFRYPPIPRLRTITVLPGPHRSEDMISATYRGLLATGFYGGQTDRESFTFTPAECRLIVDGSVRGRVRAPVLSGRIRDTLRRIDMVGDQVVVRDTSASCGKQGQWPLPVSSFAPAIRIRGVDVG